MSRHKTDISNVKAKSNCDYKLLRSPELIGVSYSILYSKYCFRARLFYRCIHFAIGRDYHSWGNQRTDSPCTWGTPKFFLHTFAILRSLVYVLFFYFTNAVISIILEIFFQLLLCPRTGACSKKVGAAGVLITSLICNANE